MASDPKSARTDTTALVETMPVALLDEPLDYVFADHFRLRRICAALRRFAEEGRVGRHEADEVVAFLTHDLPLHHHDEDDDLFPAVCRRALPEDNLRDLLTRLSADHRRSQARVERIIRAFVARGSRGVLQLASDSRRTMTDYAGDEGRHLAAENGIVLPIARARLTVDDLRLISRRMKARRGIAS